MDDVKIKLFSLWVNESKGGDKYMSGYFQDAKILIFKNRYKESDKHPDYIAYIAPGKKKEKQDDAATSSTQDITDDDIPF